MKSLKYQLPTFLVGVVTQEIYSKWLNSKAQTHLKRDKKLNPNASGRSYKEAIHKAVLESDGRDAYTGEELNWKLINKYDNTKSKLHGRAYKHQFALLPTLDHVSERSSINFDICSWRTNDAKNDLSIQEFIELCRKVIAHRSDRI